MYISLNWLKDFVDLPEIPPEELGELITKKTAEIEGFVDQRDTYANMVTGQVVSLEKHPDADKLQVAQVNIGNETVQIVCGGANLENAMYVAVTLPGSKVKWHGEGELIEIKKSKVRGVESYGMIAAAVEIGVEDPEAGEKDIMNLNADKPTPGTPLAEYLGREDIIFEFDNKSLTHRPDLWGHYGIARELAVLTNSKLKPYETKVNIPTKGQSVDVEIKDPKLCPRYCGLVIKNVKVQESPDWLKQRLLAADHSTYNNIVDVTNYVMTELGQPLHAFDQRQIQGGIIVRRAEKGEKFTDLKDGEHVLSEEMLVIADHQKNLALAGIIGGQNSMIEDDTTTVVLEAANFHPSNVRKTSVKLGVRTDAVQRFEKSLDPKTAKTAIKKAAELILQLCPDAEIAGPLTDINNHKEEKITVELNTKKVSSKIGVELESSQIKELLEKLYFTVKEKDPNTLLVTIPSFRATKDVSMQDDLVEEVARLYGYDNIPETLPCLPINLPTENTPRKAEHQVRHLLSKNLGFAECLLYSFYGEKELSDCLIPDKNHVKLHNYLSSDQTHMRTTLAPNLIKAVRENTKHTDQFKLYEIGRTYIEIQQFFPLEETWICGSVVSKSKEDKNFYQAKGTAEEILKAFRQKLKATKGIDATPYAHPNKSITYMDYQGQTIAKVYTLHPLVSKKHDLERHDVAMFELNLTALLALPRKEKKFKEINYLPSTSLDVSVLADKKTEIGQLQQQIQKADKKLITNIQLIDIYTGKNIPEDKQAVTFSITLQSDHTLTDQEISQTQAQIFQNLEKIGGEIRGK